METCEYCGKDIGIDCDGVEDLRVNPFLLEIHDIEREEWLCRGAYYELCMDI